MTLKTKRLIGFLLLFLLSITGVTLLASFATRQADQRLCNKVLIDIEQPGNDTFISKADILALMETGRLMPIGKPFHQAHTAWVEEMIRQQTIVKEAHVYSNLNGDIQIYVQQRTPIALIINAKKQKFYLDDQGQAVKTNPQYTARLLVANGRIGSPKDPLVKEIFRLATYIKNDAFFAHLIHQIYVNDKREIELIPILGRQTILFGNTENLTEKFELLRNFYKYAIPKAGWDTYTTINVKYQNQVVCIK